MSSEAPDGRNKAMRTRRAFLILFPVLAIVWAGLRPVTSTWGWDEAMHAELPAARMSLALHSFQLGEFFDVLLSCEQYPFGFPLILAAAQTVFGISEVVARAVGAALFGLGLAAIVGLGMRLTRSEEEDDPLVWRLALAFAATSPLAFAYSSTLFLEGPFVAISAFALHAWLSRSDAARGSERRRDLVCGLWLAAAFFTKFNYGLLLLAGLGVDGLFQVAAGKRAALLRLFWVAAPLVLLALWWFVLPLPGGFASAASHRAAFAGFLAGNQEMAATPFANRLLFFAGYLNSSPLRALLVVAGLLTSLACVRRAQVRCLWLVLLALGVPILLHPFHLDRFQLPLGVPLFLLAAVGWATLLGRFGANLPTLAVMIVLVFVGNPPRETVWLADQLGVLPAAESDRAYVDSVFRGWNGALAERVVPTAGLAREEADTLFDLVAAEVGPEDRVGWLGASSEISPASVHLALLARGGGAGRFLTSAAHSMDITPVPGVPLPDWDQSQFVEWADQYDVIFLTDPPDLKDRAGRRELRERFHPRLVTELGWTPRELGRITITNPPGAPIDVGLFAARRP